MPETENARLVRLIQKALYALEALDLPWDEPELEEAEAALIEALTGEP